MAHLDPDFGVASEFVVLAAAGAKLIARRGILFAPVLAVEFGEADSGCSGHDFPIKMRLSAGIKSIISCKVGAGASLRNSAWMRF